MIVAVGSDHAGFEPPEPLFKPAIIAHLKELGHEVLDCGTQSDASVDYPDFAAKVTTAIECGEADRGVLVCGTGIGISIAANRHPGIRAAVVKNEDMARLSRDHNDANVICFGRRIMTVEEALPLLDIWLEEPFSNGARHIRRIQKMG